MSKEYNEYIHSHVDNVKKAYNWLCENTPQIFNGNRMKDYLDCILLHDMSKWNKDEYNAYDQYFYGKNKSSKVLEDFDYAWLNHIHHNPHHWQHWVLIHDSPNEPETILDMPHKYIIEMICDWWAFSWKKGDLHEIFNWYAEHEDYIKLSDKTRKTVESILEAIKTKLADENE